MKKLSVSALTPAALTLALAFPAWAQASSYFVHLKAFDAKDRSEIANVIPIDTVVDDAVYSTVNEQDFVNVKKKLSNKIVESFKMEEDTVLKSMEADANAAGSDSYAFPEYQNIYHTYPQTLEMLNKFHAEYPQITSIFSIGKTVEGQEIMGIRIAGKAAQTKGSFIPGVVFVGNHHSREHLTNELALKITDHLLSNYNKDPEVTDMVNGRDIYIIPMINPDGVMYDIKGGSFHMWRKNRSYNAGTKARGVDLNRNYSFGWGQGGSSKDPSSDVYMGPTAFSEPETKNFKAFVEAHPNIRMMLSLHTFSELILYPWSGKSEAVAGKDGEVFKTMSDTMAQWNGYSSQQSSALYVATGDTCDWAYADHGIFCFTFELSPKDQFSGGGFYPALDTINRALEDNIKPAMYMVEKAADPYSVLK